MKKVILGFMVLSFTACHQKPAVIETIVVGDSAVVKVDSVKVDSLKVK